ncbi:MAG TPA: phosphatase PAP2 family protein [Actinomycetota bacterium]
MTARTLLRGVGLVGAATAVGLWSAAGRGREIDEALLEEGNRDHGPAADRVLVGVTELGSIWASAGAAAVLAVTGRHRAAGRAMAAAGVAWLAGQGLKKVFARPRPYEADPERVERRIDPPNGSSWPSSHPAVLVAFATVASRDLGVGAAGRLALDALALAVGASRVYVGVHYPADVAGGLLLGRGIAALLDR